MVLPMKRPAILSTFERLRVDCRRAFVLSPIVPSCSAAAHVLIGICSLKWATLILALLCAARAGAQTTAVLQGRVFDASDSVLPDAMVSLRDHATGFSVSVRTGPEGRYYIAAIPPATYTIAVDAPGFRTEIILELIVDVGRTVVRDFRLAVGSRLETVVVHAEVPLVDRATATIGHVVTGQTVQQIPLNGRHFTDLSLLVPGSVAPSQAGFSSRPTRGIGPVAFNTAGNREEAVAFVVNGVTTNNLTFGSLIFEPPIGSIQEFKVDNSTFGPEHGHVSGAIVNIVTRSGMGEFHGDVFEYARNDALDARNFFELATSEPNPFRKHQFGGSIGGPIIPSRTFFFSAVEGFRQQQGVAMNSLVLSDEQRAAATDPVIRRLIPLIPRANAFDANGTPRFVGSAGAVVDSNRWTVDFRHSAGRNDRFHAFYGAQRLRAMEPSSQGNSIPGFGHARQPSHSMLTVNETHTFGAGLLNEAQFGRSRLNGGTFPAALLNPADYGIANGVSEPIGLPQIVVAGDLNFGGPAIFPQGRFDTLYVFGDTLSRGRGRHLMSLGGEYRHFINENFARGTGQFNFPSVAAFLSATANAFNITLGERWSLIDQRAMALFVRDRVALHDRLTLDLGMRYEWHVTPTERDDRFVIFDAARRSLQRVGVDVDQIYQQNNKNIEPRVGLAWTLSPDGHTVVRAAYARAVDQPSTTVVRDTASNPPFAAPLAASGPIPLARAIETTRPLGLAPVTVDPGFQNASLQSWNLNLQRQVAQGTVVTLGYLGSRGTDLRISRNINQPLGGVRPFTDVSTSSPILPGTPLGDITQVESSGFSSYNAAFVSVAKRMSRGLQFDASYTWSKSLDTNSLNSSGFAIQNSHDIPNEYGLSDFDARHRFVLSLIYSLPLTGHALVRGWQVAAIVQSQSGNPVNIVTSNSSLNGMPNTVRPDVTGPIRVIGSPDQWFDPSAFVAVDRFGNLGRNVVIGPAFHNTDLSLIKSVRPGGPVGLQFRVDVFNLFNNPNFGPPGNIVGSPSFGKITRTRLPTGEAGSSRQIQLGASVSF
jgi:Carboxypeptidase regulatory-like domain/TonB dependent receptor-like, beta-barrel